MEPTETVNDDSNSKTINDGNNKAWEALLKVARWKYWMEEE